MAAISVSMFPFQLIFSYEEVGVGTKVPLYPSLVKHPIYVH